MGRREVCASFAEPEGFENFLMKLIDLLGFLYIKRFCF